MSYLNFPILHFPTIFVLVKVTCLVTLFDRKVQVLTIFGFFDELLSTQNVTVARFARNVECDIFGDFQTLCLCTKVQNRPSTKLQLFPTWQQGPLSLKTCKNVENLSFIQTRKIQENDKKNYFISTTRTLNRCLVFLTARSVT